MPAGPFFLYPLTGSLKKGYNCTTMKKTTTILLSLLLLSGVPAQSDASTLFSRICQRVDAAFSNAKKNISGVVSDIKEEASDVKEAISEKASNAKDKIVDKTIAAKEKVVEVASNIKEKTSDVYSNVKEKISDTASTVKEKVSNGIENVKDAASRTKDKVVNKVTGAKNTIVTASEDASASVSAAASASNNSINKGIEKTKEKIVHVKNQISTVFHEGLDMARSAMQSAFNMNFLSSVPVVFWKKSFDTMTDHVQESVDHINLEYEGELITRDDFQDDKALHIKKSAELALHIKSLFGSSLVAYGVTILVGGAKELIDSSFLNPNGGRCWEDFYADIVGATAVFGEKAFDKKLNKYMDSFLKENRKVDVVDNEPSVTETETETSDETVTIPETNITADTVEEPQGEVAASADAAELAQKRQRLTEAYYNAVQNGDTEGIKNISEQLKNLK